MQEREGFACIVSRLKKVDSQLATGPSVRNQRVIDLARILKDLEPVAENLSYHSSPAEVAENDVSRQKSPRNRKVNPNFPFPLFPSFF